MEEEVNLTERFGEPYFGDLTKYIHISRNVYKVPVYGDPFNPDNVTRVNTHVQNKGTTRTNELERHLRKQNPKVFFDRGVSLHMKLSTLRRILAPAPAPGAYRNHIEKMFRTRKEEALCA